MQTTSQEYQYVYLDSDSSHHHAYLMPPLLEMLSEIRLSNPQKLRVLDLGCGNGSLSHLIAQQGYEVVGVEDSEQGVAIARQSFPDCHFIQASIYDLPRDISFKFAGRFPFLWKSMLCSSSPIQRGV